MTRCFFALWPDESTRAQLDVLSQQIDQAGIRKLRPENLHVTLVFMGQIDDETEMALSEFADSLVLPGFSLRFDDIEYWQKPSVLCLTATRQPYQLMELVQRLRDKVNQFPIFQEPRPYRAHVTLARKASQNYPLVFDPVEWRAESFVLVESISTDVGVEYRVIKSWPLLSSL